MGMHARHQDEWVDSSRAWCKRQWGLEKEEDEDFETFMWNTLQVILGVLNKHHREIEQMDDTRLFYVFQMSVSSWKNKPPTASVFHLIKQVLCEKETRVSLVWQNSSFKAKNGQGGWHRWLNARFFFFIVSAW